MDYGTFWLRPSYWFQRPTNERLKQMKVAEGSSLLSQPRNTRTNIPKHAPGSISWRIPKCKKYKLRPPQILYRPTQSIMYIPFQVNTCKKRILLIVQYKYIKSCSGDFYSPESDSPHKIMRYWVYYSTQLCFWFQSDRICHSEMICIGGVPVLERHFGGAGP
jgi:hypothetical protein